MILLKFLILWPMQIASYLLWAGPLFMRLTVGYLFMVTGWGKLQNIDKVTEYFTSLNIPFPNILTPFVSGFEFLGGIFLILGILTRISAGGLSVIMIVAIISAKWSEIDSLHTLFGFEEFLFLVIFACLATIGAGKASLDYLIEKKLAEGNDGR